MTNLKVWAAALLLLTVTASCKKEKIESPVTAPAMPEMSYIDMAAMDVGNNQYKLLDVDYDGKADILFRTMLVGDPVAKQDRLHYLVETSQQINLLINNQEECPALAKGDEVQLQAPSGYNWYSIASITLAKKVINIDNSVNWQGNWINKGRRYLPFQLLKNSKTYNGWIELEADVQHEKLVLYRIGLCKEPAVVIKVGM